MLRVENPTGATIPRRSGAEKLIKVLQNPPTVFATGPITKEMRGRLQLLK